jgi:hypothetical protein
MASGTGSVNCFPDEFNMIELKYFSSNFYKVQMTEQPLTFTRKLMLRTTLSMKSGWADKSGDLWCAMYEKAGVLTFRAGAWTCAMDGDSVCALVDGAGGAALFTVSQHGKVVFEHRYKFAKWKKLATPGYAASDRFTDDFFAWVCDIWKTKVTVA